MRRLNHRRRAPPSHDRTRIRTSGGLESGDFHERDRAAGRVDRSCGLRQPRVVRGGAGDPAAALSSPARARLPARLGVRLGVDRARRGGRGVVGLESSGAARRGAGAPARRDRIHGRRLLARRLAAVRGDRHRLRPLGIAPWPGRHPGRPGGPRNRLDSVAGPSTRRHGRASPAAGRPARAGDRRGPARRRARPRPGRPADGGHRRRSRLRPFRLHRQGPQDWRCSAR